jgi:hypothetical protein
LNGERLAQSGCSAALLVFIAPLLAGRVVEWQRVGAGRRLVARDPDALRKFVVQQFPHAAGDSEDILSRTEGVARYRDSKALANDSPEMVSVRGWRQDVLRRDGCPVEVVAATGRFGVFAFLVDDPARYTLHGSCALIENPAAFVSFEQLGLPVDLALFGRGRCSSRLLVWLAAQADLRLLHLPDYDPVGLSEFARLRAALGGRVRLHLPEDLPERFARYSNPALLGNPHSRSLLMNLRKSRLREVRQVVQLIDRHNAGLEQEALLIPGSY